MSATSAPFGLRPVFHPSGVIRNRSLKNAITAAYGTSIFEGGPVKAVAGGYIEPVSGTSDRWLGSFAGVNFIPVGLQPTFTNFWLASVAFVAGSLEAFFFQDPWIEYEIQADGSVDQADLWSGTNFTNLTAGNTSTGLAGVTCTATPVTSGQAQMRVLDVAPYPDNAWGDAYTVIRVSNSLSTINSSPDVI
jgi:hypothetical protein